jgi:glycosyltransferase involved in cell wall biosynthesis
MSAAPAQISVVIPAYNAEATICDAVASALAQGVEDCRVWVIDDASRDRTLDVLEKAYGSRDDVQRVARLQNAGPASVRNQGIASSAGEWVAFLDGDDAWLPSRLSTQLALARQHPDVDLWCAQTSPMGTAPSHDSSGEPPMHRILKREEFLFHNPVATSTVLVRRSALASAGAFDEQFVGPEDYDLWMRLSERHTLALIEAPLSLYRYVPESLSMDDRTFLPQVLKVLEKALAPNGALADQAHLRKSALGNQFWNASWMAFNRGARATALRYWMKAYRLDHTSEQVRSRPWFTLLYRYCMGKRIQENELSPSGEAS